MADNHQDSPGRKPLPVDVDTEALFAKRLHEFRTEAKMTQARLAAAMTAAGYRMRQTTISEIESGQPPRPVTIGEAVMFAVILDLPLVAFTHPQLPDDPEFTAAYDDLRATRHAVFATRRGLMDDVAQLARRKQELDDIEEEERRRSRHVRELDRTNALGRNRANTLRRKT